MATFKMGIIDENGTQTERMYEVNPGSLSMMAHGLNASDQENHYPKTEDEEVLRRFVEGKFKEWGLIAYLGKRGEAGNRYRAMRLKETTAPGVKQITMSQLNREMDALKVLYIANTNEKPVRSAYQTDRDYEAELRRRIVKIDLPRLTGYARVHIKPQAGIAFTLRGEELVRRDFTGVRYEVYSYENQKHVANPHKFDMAQDGRSFKVDETEVEAELFIDHSVLTDADMRRIVGEQKPGQDVGESGNDESEPESDNTDGFYYRHMENGLKVFNRGEDESIASICHKIGIGEQTYYRWRKIHLERGSVPANVSE